MHNYPATLPHAHKKYYRHCEFVVAGKWTDGRMTDPTVYRPVSRMPNGLDPAFTGWAVRMASTAVDASLAERESER